MQTHSTRWSDRDYPLNMTSQPPPAPRDITVVSKCALSVEQVSLAVYVCSRVQVSAQGYSNNCGLSFVFSCTEKHSTTHTCLELYSHICAVVQISPPPPPHKHLLQADSLEATTLNLGRYSHLLM